MKNNNEIEKTSLMGNKKRLLIEFICLVASLLTILQFWKDAQSYKQENIELKKYRLEVLSNQSSLKKMVTFLIPVAEKSATSDEKQTIETIKNSLKKEARYSGLTWSNKFNEPCTWTEANESNYGVGWRLPTIQEAQLFINKNNENFDQIFIEHGYYWTSSTDGNKVQIINFKNGKIRKAKKDNLYFFLLVRKE